MKNAHIYEKLGQYDYFEDDYIDEVKEKYAYYIGLFLINFNSLEHELGHAITMLINQRTDQPGYQVVESLTTKNKADLFYRLYLELATYNGPDQKSFLKRIYQQLKTINSFRNSLIHSNWLTLRKDGYVRVKIITNLEEGSVDFKMVKITPKLIIGQLKMIRLLNADIEKITEEAFKQ